MAAGLLLSACGDAVAPPGDVAATPDDGSATSTEAPAATNGSTVTDPDAVLTGQGLLLQKGDEPTVLCLGAVAESYPPQCSGPGVVGLDWADVPNTETASGVTWGEARVVGTYDGSTFTLTEPPSEMRIPVEPDGGTGADPFPQLCDDPFRGGDEQAVADPESAMAAQEALGQLLESYDGHVGSWVSTDLSDVELEAETPHVPTYNVLVTGDAEQAHADFREVWPGGLCVEQRDVPTESQVRQAQQAVTEAGITGVLSSGGGASDGMLHVGVLLADATTVEAIHTAVEQWLTPEQVDIQGALTPIQSQG